MPSNTVSAGSDDSRHPAVVLGLSSTGMGVIRSLAGLGVEIHGVYHDPAAEIARHSRRLRSRYRLADPDSDRELLQILQSIRQRTEGPERIVLIPTSDRFARFLSDHRDVLHPEFLFRVPPREIQTTFLDKRATADICREHSVLIPPTHTPETIDDVESIAPALRYPVIIKPAGHDDTGFPGKNIVVSEASELIRFYRTNPQIASQTVLQEFIPSGDGHILYACTYSGADGSVIARCSFRKLRQWLPDRGVTSYGVSETMEDLLDRTTKFLDAIGYVGFAGVEFAEDTRTGEVYFLELNARAVLPNRLVADAGVDLTAIAYLEMCGLDPAPVTSQHDGVYWMDVQRDIPSSVVRWSRGELRIRDWLRDARRSTSFSTWDRHDLRPFVASLRRLVTIGLGLERGKQAASIRSIPGAIDR